MPQRQIVRQRRIATVIVAVVGLGVTAVGGWFVYDSYQRLREEQTAAQIDTAATAVKVALDRVAISVRAVRGLYAADMVTEDEFDPLRRSRWPEPRSCAAIGFLRRVERRIREQSTSTRFTSEPAKTLGIWQAGADGKPVRAGDRPVYFVIESGYLPSGGEPAYGFDAASDPVRSKAIEQTIGEFQLVVSDAVTLLSSGEPGVVFYRSGARPQRRRDRGRHRVGHGGRACPVRQAHQRDPEASR